MRRYRSSKIDVIHTRHNQATKSRSGLLNHSALYFRYAYLVLFILYLAGYLGQTILINIPQDRPRPRLGSVVTTTLDM